MYFLKQKTILKKKKIPLTFKKFFLSWFAKQTQKKISLLTTFRPFCDIFLSKFPIFKKAHSRMMNFNILSVQKKIFCLLCYVFSMAISSFFSSCEPIKHELSTPNAVLKNDIFVTFTADFKILGTAPGQENYGCGNNER